MGLVAERIVGEANKIDFNEKYQLSPSPDIFAHYRQLRDVPDNYSPFHPDAAAIIVRRADQKAKYAQLRRKTMLEKPQLVPLKIGRNDPCICGSGKKYKKCCGA